MAEEAEEYIYEVYGEECEKIPSGPQVDRLITTIKLHPGSTRMELWNLLPLPRGMNYSAFANILCTLVKQVQVAIDAEDRYTWIGVEPAPPGP
jgi:hypothetical protein